MKKKNLNILMVIGILITIYGLITGRFLFLLFIIPMSLGFFKSDSYKKDD